MAIAAALALLAQEGPGPARRLYDSLSCELREVRVEWHTQALGAVRLGTT